MSILTSSLPQEVEIDGRNYWIDTDFRTIINFEQILYDDEIEEEDRAERVLSLFYEEIPDNLPEAFEKILWLYSGGDQEESTGESNSKGVIGYSFEEDADYIYAAFLNQYGIDLNEIEYMHWWKFQSLFKALNEDCEFIKIVGYRTIEINSNMSKEERDFYKKMKKKYALKKHYSKDEIELKAAIEEALMNGGDISGLI